VRSVTVLVPSAPHAGLAAEALSKTIFVLGAARGLAHIERLRGVDAIVVDAAGGMHHSSGLRGARAAAVGEP
jgi:thiamine biosynthesis lipoprotein